MAGDGLRRATRLRWSLALLTVLVTGSPSAGRAQVDDTGEPTLDVLLAPVALFPDPLLAAVLQASVVPLDIVMASRFLDDHAKDPTKVPSSDWDPAVLGLLAYPTVLNGMNEHLDWVESVGDAVVNQLPAVQDAIQQDRAEFYAGGILRSDERQTVEVDGDVIRIVPVDANQLFVPVYDPPTLVAFITAPGPATSEAVPVEPPPVPASPGQSEPAVAAPATTAAPPASPPAAAAPVETTSPPPLPVEPAPAMAPAPTAVPITYAAPVTYAPAPETGSSLWPAVGGFAGGALVGGILGYALGDDDNDHDNGWHSDLDENDLEDLIDQADENRDEARRERQDYATGAREDRQDFANQSREDRQQHQNAMTSQAQQARLQREQMRKNNAAQAQAQLASRAQRTPATARQAGTARRAPPSPAQIQSAVAPSSRQAVPRFAQAGQAAPRAATTAALPRTAKATPTAQRAPARVGDQRDPAKQKSALANIQRGATTRQQELRGAQSRQQLARPASAASRNAGTVRSPPAKREPAAAKRQAGGGRQALQVGGGGRAQAQAERGRNSRRQAR